MPETVVAAPPTYPIRPVVKPEALVLCCGDPRFQEPVRRFLEQELGLPEGSYMPIVAAGGAASLLIGEMRPKEAKYLREAIAFYLDHFSGVHRVVVINHEDCAKYRDLEKMLPLFSHFHGGLTARQKVDLARVAEYLLGLADRHLTVESYYATFANPERTLVAFHRQ